jgi:hypothetical protein
MITFNMEKWQKSFAFTPYFCLLAVLVLWVAIFITGYGADATIAQIFPIIGVTPFFSTRITQIPYFFEARKLATSTALLMNLDELFVRAISGGVDSSIPSSWSLFGSVNTITQTAYIPGVGFVPINQLSTYAPNSRIHFVGVCSCLWCKGLQEAGGLSGHNFSQGLIYIEPNITPVQLRLPQGTIQFTLPRPIVRTPQEIPPETDPGPPIISLIVSIAVQAALQAAQDHRVWLGVRFGATGNMYRQELTAQENRTPRQMPKTGMQFNGFPGPIPIESNPAYNPFPHHTGIQDLPVFDRVPIARREAVKVPVRFDSYATVNAFDYVGGFNDHLSNNDIRNFVEAYLSLQYVNMDLPVVSQYYNDIDTFNINYGQWRLQWLPTGLVELEELYNVGLEAWLAARPHIPPPPQPPVMPPEVASLLANAPYLSINGYTREYFKAFTIHEVVFMGLDFTVANPLFVEMKKVGTKYIHYFADNTVLTIESWFTKEMVDSCYGFLPAGQRETLKQMIDLYPIKPIFPKFFGTARRGCDQANPEPRRLFEQVGTEQIPIEVTSNPVGSKLKKYVHFVSMPFDGLVFYDGCRA